MILSDVSPQSDRKWNPDDSHKRIENFQRKLWRLVHDAIYLQKADNLPELSQEEFQKQVHKCWDARNYYLRVGIFLTYLNTIFDTIQPGRSMLSCVGY